MIGRRLAVFVRQPSRGLLSRRSARTARHPPRPRRPARPLLAAALLAWSAGGGGGVALHLLLRAGPPLAPALPSLYGQAVWAPGRGRRRRFALRRPGWRVVSLPGAARAHARSSPSWTPSARKPARSKGKASPLPSSRWRRPSGPTLVIVSLDPGATPAETRRAIHRWGIVGEWHWLLGTRSRLLPSGAPTVSAPARAVPRRAALPSTSSTAAAFERAGVHAPFLPQFLADDLRALAGEARRLRGRAAQRSSGSRRASTSSTSHIRACSWPGTTDANR